VEVDHDDHVSIGGEQLGIPAIAPVVSPGPLRSAVDEELHGILFAGIEVGGLDEEALDFVAVRAGEPEGFEGGHGDLGENGVIEMGQLFSLWKHTVTRLCLPVTAVIARGFLSQRK